MPFSYHVAWWNVENLFDEEHAPLDRRPEKVRRAIQEDIKNWTPRLRDRKVAQLASVIVQMNAGNAPDLLGVCEVENRFVLNLLVDAVAALLPARRYQVVHADTSDARGIDVAFLYDPRPVQRPERRDVLPRRDAPQRHPGDRAGQLPHPHRADLGSLR